MAAVLLVVGFVLVVTGTALLAWQVGLIVAGALLLAGAIDLRS